MAMWCIIVTKNGKRPNNLYSWRIHWHQNRCMSLLLIDSHDDRHLASWIPSSADPPFAAIEDIPIFPLLNTSLEIAGIRGGYCRLTHDETTLDVALEERLQPFFLLVLGSIQENRLHDKGVRGATVENLWTNNGSAHDFTEMCIL